MTHKSPFVIDATIQPLSVGDISIRPDFNRQSLKARLEVPLLDYEEGVIRDYVRAEIAERMQHPSLMMRGRRGWNMTGLVVERDTHEAVEFGYQSASVPVCISSLRDSKHDDMLSILKLIAKTEKQAINAGSLLVIPPAVKPLTREQIDQAVKEGQLWLPPDAVIDETGLVHLPLLPFRHVLVHGNIDEEAIRHILRAGKHALAGIQETEPMVAALQEREFLSSSVRISLGAYDAVMTPVTDVNNVANVSANLLEGVRTTGNKVPRQVQVFNHASTPVRTSDISIQLRIYPASDSVQKVASRIITPATLKGGVGFIDVADVEKNPEPILRLLDEVSSVPLSEDQPQHPYGRVVAGGRSAEIDWTPHSPDAQNRQTMLVMKSLVAADPAQRNQRWVAGQGIPRALRPLADMLGYVGGNQREGKALITHGFPSVPTMNQAMDTGTGVFIARDLQTRLDAFPDAVREQISDEPSALHAVRQGKSEKEVNEHANFYNSTLYEQHCALERRGAVLLRMFPGMADAYSDRQPPEDIPPHVRQFFRGFWVRVNERERVRKVDTILALYGTALHAKTPEEEGELKRLNAFLGGQVRCLLSRMQSRLTDGVAVTHGNGPGFMNIVDKEAEKLDIVRFGVGISVEGEGLNPRPEAVLDMQNAHRLRRQKVMDDIGAFKGFGIGGAGSLEEAAITLCSQKLGKNLITPIVFVDPFGLYDGKNLWTKFFEQIEVLASNHTINFGEAEQANMNVRLLAGHASKYVHLVKSFDDMADILLAFIDDPVSYYKQRDIPAKVVLSAYDEGETTHQFTGFPRPSFIPSREELERGMRG